MPKRGRYTTTTGFRPPGRGRSRAASTVQRAWRAKRRRNALVSVPRGKLGFPQSMRTTLKYADKFELDLPTSDCKVVTIRANSIFDPDYSSSYGDHQPRGADDFSDIYTDYCVTACRVKATAMYQGYNGPVNYSISNSPPSGSLVQVFPNPDDYSSAVSVDASCPVGFIIQKSSEIASSASGSAENFQKKLEYDRTVSTYINSVGQHKTLKTSMNIASFFGVKPGDLVGMQEYSGKTGGVSDGSNPANVPYIHCIVGNVGHIGLTEPQKTGVTIFVEAEFDVVYTNPKKLQAS